jgi:hypothetical protein
MNTEKNLPAAVSTNVVPMTESATLLAMISRAATDPSCDVEKMERLYAMHERMCDRQAAEAFAVAMSKAQAQVTKAVKDRHNEQTKSDYATLEAIDAAVRPVYTAHGFSLSFDTVESPLANHVRVACHVMHAGGHAKTYTYDNPMDDTGIAGKVNKTPTHARGSAVTYGRRYLTLLIFNLSTGYHDDDGNGAGAEPEPEYLDWNEAIRGAFSADELRAVKKEMADKFGADKVPASLVRSYNARFAEVRA